MCWSESGIYCIFGTKRQRKERRKGKRKERNKRNKKKGGGRKKRQKLSSFFSFFFFILLKYRRILNTWGIIDLLLPNWGYSGRYHNSLQMTLSPPSKWVEEKQQMNKPKLEPLLSLFSKCSSSTIYIKKKKKKSYTFFFLTSMSLNSNVDLHNQNTGSWAY